MAITPTAWNPSDKHADITLSGSNLIASTTSSTARGARSVFSASSGKFYWEATLTTLGTYAIISAGIATSAYLVTTGLGSDSVSWARATEYAIHSNSVVWAYVDAVQGDIISVALDLDNGKIWWALNGTWYNSGAPASGTNAGYTGITGTIYAACSLVDESLGSETQTVTTNFGASAFSHSVPSGFESGFGEELIINESSITFSVKQTNHYNPFPILGGV